MSKVTVTFSEKLIKQIDETRKSESRASYIRRQVESGFRRHPPAVSVLEEVAQLRVEVQELRALVVSVTAKRSGEEIVI